MSIKKSIVITGCILLGVFIVLFTTITLLRTLSDGMCGNEVIKKEISPDGLYIAYAFLRNCGATTSFSPQVTIMKNGKELKNEGGNIFIGNRSEYIDIKWEDSKTLIIYHTVNANNIHKQEDEIYGIRIKYNTK